MLLLGKAGGSIKAGMHYRDPNPSANSNAPKVLLTAVRAVGAPVTKLGQANSDGSRVATETISAIEA